MLGGIPLLIIPLHPLQSRPRRRRSGGAGSDPWETELFSLRDDVGRRLLA